MQKMSLADLINKMQTNWPQAVNPETEAILGIIRLNDVVRNTSDPIIADHNLTHTEFEVLTALRAMPEPRELTPTELYSSLLVTSGGMTKVLKNLEERGFIERHLSGGDGRSKPVRLTDTGAEIIEKTMTAVVQGDRNLLSRSLSKEDTQRLRQILLQALKKLE